MFGTLEYISGTSNACRFVNGVGGVANSVCSVCGVAKGVCGVVNVVCEAASDAANSGGANPKNSLRKNFLPKPTEWPPAAQRFNPKR